MITADQLDKVCVLTYRVIQGDTHMLTADDWDLLEEVAVHAEDVMSLRSEDDDDNPDNEEPKFAILEELDEN